MTKRQWWVISGLGALFTIVIGALQWYKYSTFGYNGLDLGIYTQAVWSLAHGFGFASSIHDPSYLGDHLEVWLIPLSWVYRLWESPLLLLWVQTLVIASSIIPLAKITQRLLNTRAAIIATALFVIHPLVYNIALYEFHALVFALPLIFWSIWFYLKQRLIWWLVTLLALVIVREDMPFVVAGWAIMAAIDRRSWKWWLAPILIATTWFPLAQSIIKAANHDGVYKYLAFYGWMGTSIPEILTFPFRHPILFIQHIITFNNLGTIIGMVVTFGFLPFLRMKQLWPLAIIFAQLLIGNAQPGSFLKIHYTIPYVPFLAWATLEAYRDIRNGKICYHRLGKSPSLTVATLLLIIGPLYSSLIVGPLQWPWKNTSATSVTTPQLLRQALQHVQPTDRVLTTFAYLPNLANRQNLYSLNYLYLGRRQYSEIPYRLPTDIDVAIIDWQQLYDFQFLYRTTVFEGRSGLQRIQDLLNAQGLGVVQRYGSVLVYRQGGSPDNSGLPLTIPSDQIATKLGPVNLIGQPRLTVADHILYIQSDWQAVSTEQDHLISLRYILKKNNEVVLQQSQIIGQGRNPVSEWSAGSSWMTQDAVLLPANLRGAVHVTAEIFIPQGRYRLNRLQTFRPIIDSRKVLGTVELGEVQL